MAYSERPNWIWLVLLALFASSRHLSVALSNAEKQAMVDLAYAFPALQSGSQRWDPARPELACRPPIWSSISCNAVDGNVTALYVVFGRNTQAGHVLADIGHSTELSLTC
jgi:hypothetical protein